MRSLNAFLVHTTECYIEARQVVFLMNALKSATDNANSHRHQCAYPMHSLMGLGHLVVNADDVVKTVERCQGSFDGTSRNRGRVCHVSEDVSIAQADGVMHLRIITHLSVCLRFFRIFVEETGITSASLHWWYVRSIDVLPGETFPCNFSKPRVLHDVLATAVQVTQSLGQVGCDEFAKQVLCIWMNIRRVLNTAFQDIFVDLEW